MRQFDIHPELVRALRYGNVIPFIGSGLSFASTIKSWKDMIEELHDDLEARNYGPLEPFPSNYLKIAEHYEFKMGKGALAGKLIDWMQPRRLQPSDDLIRACQLADRIVVTTNFDDLIERAFRDLSRRVDLIVYDRDWSRRGLETQQADEAVQLFKLHGTIEDPDSCIFTQEQYDSYSRDRSFLDRVVQTYIADGQNTFLFLGFSLNDPHFYDLYSEVNRVLENKQPLSFAIIPDCREGEQEFWFRRNVIVSNVAADDIGHLLEEMVHIKYPTTIDSSEGLVRRELEYRERVKTQFEDTHALGNRHTLSEVYIPLAWTPGGSTHAENQPVSPETAIDSVQKCILFGGPGSGKSSSLNRLAYSCATDAQRPLPIYIRLSEYGRATPRIGLPAYLTQVVRDKYGMPPAFCNLVDQKLREGTCLLLLDGWDEVAEEHRSGVMAGISRLLNGALTKNQIVISSRFLNDPDTRRLTDQLDVFEIDRVSTSQIERFSVEDWFTDSSQGRGIYRNILEDPRLLALARNPFMLSALCLIGESGTLLSDSRAEIYLSCIQNLYESGNPELSWKLIEKYFCHVALRLFDRPDPGDNDETIFSLAQVDSILIEHGRTETLNAPIADILSSISDCQLFDRVGDDDLIVIHRTIWEYLVARNLWHQGDTGIEFLLARLENPKWEEVVRLYMGILSPMEGAKFFEYVWEQNPFLAMRSLGENLNIDEGRVRTTIRKTHWQKRADLVQSLAQDSDGKADQIVETLREWLKGKEPIDESNAPILYRETNGNVLHYAVALLTRLGGEEALKIVRDRFRVGVDRMIRSEELPSDKWTFVDLVTSFPRGSNDSEAPDNEKPITQIRVPSFHIMKYQVTNQEYEQFDPEHHSERAPDISHEDDEPVTDLTWFEASMYCLWKGYRLPSEAQWELAGSWDPETETKRIFPWGDAWDPQRCNSIESVKPIVDGRVKNIVSVSEYESVGASACGCVNMAGNVWEWCRDWYLDDFYHQQINSESWQGPQIEGSLRSIRGGCFFNDQKRMRCTHREAKSPDHRDPDFGFRCVVDIAQLI